jgi:multidrug efflux pump subunit AcrB
VSSKTESSSFKDIADVQDGQKTAEKIARVDQKSAIIYKS